MSVSAERLCQQSNLEPTDLDESIINPDDDASIQLAAMIAWVDANVLPIADGEVSVPLLETTGYDTVDDFIDQRFASISSTVRSGWKTKGNALYDGAVLSYGRSEINKSINSTSSTYDQDSDQDRIQGNQRLQKLINWATTLIQTQGDGNANQSRDHSNPTSMAVQTTAGW